MINLFIRFVFDVYLKKMVKYWIFIILIILIIIWIFTIFYILLIYMNKLYSLAFKRILNALAVQELKPGAIAPVL